MTQGVVVEDVRPAVAGDRILSHTGVRYLLELLCLLIAGITLGSLIVWLVGENPWHVYSNLLREAFFTSRGQMIAIQRATPYILTAAGAVLAFQGGAINMGLDGQFLVGAAVAGIVGYSLPELSPPIKISLIFLACALGGAAAAFIPAIVTHLSGVSEVVTGMIANLLIPHLLRAIIFTFPLLRAAQQGASQGLPPNAHLPQFVELSQGGIGLGSKANVGIFVALLLIVVIRWWMKRSTVGYELRMTRASYALAEFSGLPAWRMFFISMMLSGAIAGMAGATEILGVWRQYSLGTVAVGDKGLVIALVGGTHFVGAAVASLLYGGLEAGAMNAAWFTSIPRPLIDILVQMLFLLAAIPSMRRFFSHGRNADKEALGTRYLDRRPI